MSTNRSITSRTASVPARSTAWAPSRSTAAANPDLAVPVSGQRVVVAPLPHRCQRRGHQRECGVVSGHVRADLCRQRGLHGAACAAGGHLDDSAELVGRRRSDEDLRVFHQRGERPGCRQLGVLVAAQHDDDVHVEGGVERELHEPDGEPSTASGREELLELVDDEQHRAGGVDALHGFQRGHRVGPGNDHRSPPRSRTRQAATAHQGHEPGPHERGLATPG